MMTITKSWIRERIAELSKERFTDKNFGDSIHWRHVRKFEADLINKSEE